MKKKQVTWKTSVLLRRARCYETNATGTTRIGLKTKKRRRLNDRWQTVNTSYCTSGLLHLDVRGHGKEVACCCCAWGIYLLVYTHAWSLFASRWTTRLLACWTSRLQADGLQVHGPPWQLDGGMQRRIRWNTDDDRVDKHRCTDKRWIWLSLLDYI